MNDAELAAGGWRRLPTRRFSRAIGPVYVSGERGAWRLGFAAGEQATNDQMRSIHGGALMTFADMALGHAVAGFDGKGGGHITTVQLQYQFAGAVVPGDFVVCAAEVVRRTRRLAFVRALFEVGDRVVGSADAIFRVFDKAGDEQA